MPPQQETLTNLRTENQKIKWYDSVNLIKTITGRLQLPLELYLEFNIFVLM